MTPHPLERPRPPSSENFFFLTPLEACFTLRSEAAHLHHEESRPHPFLGSGHFPCGVGPLDGAPPVDGVAGVFRLTAPPSPHAQSKDGVGDGHRGTPATPHRSRKSQTRSRIFRELVHIAAEQGHSIPLGVTTADALQECLDRAVALYRFAADQVDNLSTDLPEGEEHLSNLPTSADPLFEVISNPQGPDVIQPHRYVLMEREARQEVEKLASMMTQLGIAERVVRVQEAQAVLVVAAIREAAIETGLSQDQVRRLGEAIRGRLDDAALKQRRGLVEGKNDNGKDARRATSTLKQLENG